MKKIFELYKEKKTGDSVYVAPILQNNLKDIQSELVSEFDIDATLNMDETRLVGINIKYNGARIFVTASQWLTNEFRCIGYNEVTRDVFTFPISMLLENYIRPFQIPIKYFSEEIEKLQYIGGKSDWIDLRSAIEIEMKAGEFKLIPLGIGMQLPKGYEAHIVPRSSTFKNYGIIQTNSMGVIDETYCGDNDQWFFPAFALRDSIIHINDRICQFRIMEHQPILSFSEVNKLENEDRGGHGSTGKQ